MMLMTFLFVHGHGFVNIWAIYKLIELFTKFIKLIFFLVNWLIINNNIQFSRKGWWTAAEKLKI